MRFGVPEDGLWGEVMRSIRSCYVETISSAYQKRG